MYQHWLEGEKEGTSYNAALENKEAVDKHVPMEKVKANRKPLKVGVKKAMKKKHLYMTPRDKDYAKKHYQESC